MRLDTDRLAPMANAIRALSMDAVEAANSGHPGMPMGMADVATVLWSEYLKHDPATPDWADRDRFVLSAGHGSMLLAAAMSGEHVSDWAADGFPLQVREVPRDAFTQLAADPAAVAVQDSGFTEVAPGSTTVVALPGAYA